MSNQSDLFEDDFVIIDYPIKEINKLNIINNLNKIFNMFNFSINTINTLTLLYTTCKLYKSPVVLYMSGYIGNINTIILYIIFIKIIFK